MADDVTLNGTTVPLGPKIKTDEIAGVHWQQVKMAVGVDGVATPVSTADPMPVSIISGGVTVDTTGLATDAKQDDQIGLLFEIRGSLNNPLPLMDGAAQEGTMSAILSKIIAAPSTEAKQDSVISALASILSKIIAAPATEAKQDTGNTSLGSIKTNTDKIPALGQALASASVPVVLPALQITALTPPAAITGFATETTLAAQSAKLPATLGAKAIAASLSVNIASDQTVPISVASLPIPSGAATSAKQDLLLTELQAKANLTQTQPVSVATMPLPTGASTDAKLELIRLLLAGTLATKEIRSTSSSVSSPAVTTSSSTALASNTSRLGAIIWNEGSAIVYLKLGATASATSYTIQLDSGEFYELPSFYTGIVDVIAASGTATLRVTELS